MERTFDEDAKLGEDMAGMARYAVVLARNSVGVVLDFTEATIPDVDAVGRHYHKVFKPRWFRKPDEREFSTVAAVLGAYVGEVYRATYGGAWGWVDNGSYPPVATLRSVDGALFWPVARSRKFLENGDEDNFTSYYAALHHLATGGSPEALIEDPS
jgi:hypothetical protein